MWELSIFGHPLADFVYHAMMYRVPPPVVAEIVGAALKYSRQSNMLNTRLGLNDGSFELCGGEFRVNTYDGALWRGRFRLQIALDAFPAFP